MDRRFFFRMSATTAIGSMVVGRTIAAPTASIKQKSTKFRIPDLAQKPPLGWNSFDSYGVYLHFDAAMDNLEAFSKKLQPHGYEYFVIDLGWYGKYNLIEGTMFPNEKHASDLSIDEYGLLEPGKTYFAKGLKPIIDRAHELGLKIGVHMMRGIPRKAVELNTPIMGTNYKAADIANKNNTCAWCHHNYGIDTSKPGAQEYYNSAYKKLAGWEIDFVKVDDLIPYPDEMVMIANAIENSGREMVFSLSPGGTTNLRDLPYYRKSNMVRITADIWDRRIDLNKAFTQWRVFQGMGNPGFWPDLDMIPFGHLQMMQPRKYQGKERDVRLSGYGFKRVCQLTKEEMKTFITIRALAASPIMMGGDLPTLDDFSLSLITNQDMLECNQNGQTGVLVYEKDNIEVWMANKTDEPGKGWLGIFNLNESPKTVMLNAKDFKLGITPNTRNVFEYPVPGFKMKDIWNKEEFIFHASGKSFRIPDYGVVFLVFEEVK